MNSKIISFEELISKERVEIKMSTWSCINGVITVVPIGMSQPQKRYIIDTMLAHLPRVTGSEGKMDVHVIQKNGYDHLYFFDEFGQRTNNLTDINESNTRHGCMRVQDEYLLVVDGILRDTTFAEALRLFQRWLCRLAKRIMVDSVLVEVREDEQSTIITNSNDTYGKMFEHESWTNNIGESNWCEFMLWDIIPNSNTPIGYPVILKEKYANKRERAKS
jgi:hypothetical protein